MPDATVRLLLGLNVSRETEAELRAFLALVEKWNAAINLIARSTLAEAWGRHVLDSVQVFPLAPQSVKRWADFGSGAGFPGVVVAILSKQLRPDCETFLIESDLRKATFLREVVRTLSLKATVLSERIDETAPLGCDVVSARALAPLDKLLPLALRHLTPNGTALFLKGRTYQQEIAEAQKTYRFRVEKIGSEVDAESAVLRLQGIEKVEV
jgi:16S rRNA (guanine527-N7)-methyltransferase